MAYHKDDVRVLLLDISFNLENWVQLSVALAAISPAPSYLKCYPNTIEDFRLIAWSTMLNKIVIKVNNATLHQVIDHLIDPAQAAVINSKLIADNIFY